VVSPHLVLADSLADASGDEDGCRKGAVFEFLLMVENFVKTFRSPGRFSIIRAEIIWHSVDRPE